MVHLPTLLEFPTGHLATYIFALDDEQAEAGYHDVIKMQGAPVKGNIDVIENRVPALFKPAGEQPADPGFCNFASKPGRGKIDEQ